MYHHHTTSPKQPAQITDSYGKQPFNKKFLFNCRSPFYFLDENYFWWQETHIKRVVVMYAPCGWCFHITGTVCPSWWGWASLPCVPGRFMHCVPYVPCHLNGKSDLEVCGIKMCARPERKKSWEENSKSTAVAKNVEEGSPSPPAPRHPTTSPSAVGIKIVWCDLAGL